MARIVYYELEDVFAAIWLAVARFDYCFFCCFF